MGEGYQTALQSYNWARLFYINAQIQRHLPRAGTNPYNKPTQMGHDARVAAANAGAQGRRLLESAGQPEPAAPQQADLDYNFAALSAAETEIAIAQYSYHIKQAEIRTKILSDFSTSERPPLEKLDLLIQFDTFSKDISTCFSFNERKFGTHALRSFVQLDSLGGRHPNVDEKPPVAQKKDQLKQAQAREQEIYVSQSQMAIDAIKPSLLQQINSAGNQQSLIEILPHVFGDTRTALRAGMDPEIKQALSKRRAALEAERINVGHAEEERRASANQARITAAFNNNGSPILADLQSAILKASMELSSAKQKLPSERTSPNSYKITGFNRVGSVATREISIDIGDFSCKPLNGGQFCNYSERVDYRLYITNLLSKYPTRGALSEGLRENRSGIFNWTPEGLVAARGNAGPAIGFLNIVVETYKVEYEDRNRPNRGTFTRLEDRLVNRVEAAQLP